MLQPLKGKGLQCFKTPPKRLNILEGSVSSSKTFTTHFTWIDFVINGPPGGLLMSGKTERTLKRNVIDPLVQIYGERNVNTVGMGKGEIQIFGRRVYLVGANDERAEQKIRGMSLVGAYCDEITLYPESFWIMLLSRLREKGAILWGTTNPDGPQHWLKVNFLDKNLPHLNSWHFSLEDNPYLDPDYVTALKQEYTGLFYRRFILGEWCLAEGAIFDMWDEKKHVTKTLPEKYDFKVVTIDYGTANPCVFLLYGVVGTTAYCIKEYYYDGKTSQRQKTDAEYSKDMAAFVEGHDIRYYIIDPSALSFKTQLQRDSFGGVRDADNSVLDGIRVMASMLTAGRYLVHESCRNHIKEFSGYVWDAKAQEKGEDKPMKQNDHTMDAGRYLCQTLFSRDLKPRAMRSI